MSGPTTTSPATAQINVGIVVASGLGGALVTLIAGLIFFCIWKQRLKRKLRYTLSNTPSLTTTQPALPPSFPPPPPPSEPISPDIIVPALYDIPLSRRGSYVSVTPQVVYHYYEETF